MTNPLSLLIQIKNLILFFIISLALSGITAFFVETELRFLIDNFNFGHLINNWLYHVHNVLADLNKKQPFISYGYDWLAFGHLIIALFFVGALKKPIENNWVIRYGMIACVAIFPVAFIAGYFRSIPILWQIIDCSFGIFGFILLFIINKKTVQLKKQIQYG
ncbi:MAG: hypothetical protein DWP98_09970 [Bacteroidetes bacterium]|nr:MAG: hypothetical protein DWP98_09970 [Bacteroidota bacterium]MBL1144742.1 hypothetical protein [Bacteroidota bacterium]NOG57536.1 hypothetical protein [Bacteroidota bacterium]